MQRVTVTAARLGARNFSASADPYLPVRKLGSFGRKLRDVPNEVTETQKFFRESTKYTFLKKDTDKFVQGLIASVIGVGTLLFLKGMYIPLLQHHLNFSAPHPVSFVPL